jgi:ubiquinone/menaquinone biosynthesis C-methylase UbiE
MNVDPSTVSGFGDEWKRFDQSILPFNEQWSLFLDYFDIFPWNKVNSKSVGFDMGCGTGRWAELVAERVQTLHCIDPSYALSIARVKLARFDNIVYHNANSENVNIKEGSMDFGYSLGVLHHIPDTKGALKDCVKLLKPGGIFLVYLYYSFDNKPYLFKFVWRCTNLLRRLISRQPNVIKNMLCDLLAFFVYWPMGRLCLILEKLGFNIHNIPLSPYRNRSFYSMRTDSLDRFGTRLEHRFTKVQIKEMMEECGLEDIMFSNKAPFWCAVGVKK